jgi:hypothetical protein
MGPFADRELGKMILPGSHDAGTAKGHIDLYGIGATVSNSATQTLTIPEQLDVGTRFFDLRLKEHGGQVVAHHTTAGLGAYSQHSVDSVIRDVDDWCSKHKTEVVIIRISHTKLATNAHTIVRNSAAKNQLCTATGNLCSLKLKDILKAGGGLICIFDEEKFGNQIDQAHGIHGFKKFKGNATLQGISTCGCYKGSHKLQEVIGNALKGQFEHNEKHSPDNHDHLWQIYWQKTYTNPFSKTGIEGGTTKGAVFSTGERVAHGGTQASTEYLIHLMEGHAGDYVDNLALAQGKATGNLPKDKVLGKKKVPGKFFKQKVMLSTLGVRQYCLPNIISYDFVKESLNRYIAGLNDPGTQQTQVNDTDNTNII